MNNLYSSPEKFGLTTVGEIDWSDGCYQFDLTAVFRRDTDGRLAYVEDSGCSCPCPFEGKGVDDLTLCTPAELQAQLEKRQAEHASYESDDYRAGAIADLMQRIMTAVSVPGEVVEQARALPEGGAE